MNYIDIPLKRFWAKVERRSNDECWEWTAAKKPSGYGHLKIQGRTERAHRISWTLHLGPIPGGMLVLHTCDTPSCVNPRHLYLGKDKENVRDMHGRGRNPKQFPGRGRMTEADVAAARSRYAAGDPISHIAKDLGMSCTAIRECVTGRTWTT